MQANEKKIKIVNKNKIKRRIKSKQIQEDENKFRKVNKKKSESMIKLKNIMHEWEIKINREEFEKIIQNQRLTEKKRVR